MYHREEEFFPVDWCLLFLFFPTSERVSEGIVHSGRECDCYDRYERERDDIDPLVYTCYDEDDCDELPRQIESEIDDTLERYDHSHECEECGLIQVTRDLEERRYIRKYPDRHESPDNEIDGERDEWK